MTLRRNWYLGAAFAVTLLGATLDGYAEEPATETQTPAVKVLRMDSDVAGRVEATPGRIFRKTIVAEDMSISVFWMRPPKDPNESLMPQGHHHGEEIFYVVKGKGVLIANGSRYPYQSGDILVIPAGVVHTGEILSDEVMIVAVESPPRPGIRSYFEDQTQAGTAPVEPAK